MVGDVELLLDARADLGEAPSWDADARVLIWVDITTGLVHRFDPGTDRDEVFEVGQPVGAALPTSSGRIALAANSGFLLLDPATGNLERVAEVEADVPETMMNDGKCDPSGRFWAGTKDVEGRRPLGSLYRLDADHRLTRVLKDVTISNGLGWSPDRPNDVLHRQHHVSRGCVRLRRHVRRRLEPPTSCRDPPGVGAPGRHDRRRGGLPVGRVLGRLRGATPRPRRPRGRDRPVPRHTGDELHVRRPRPLGFFRHVRTVRTHRCGAEGATARGRSLPRATWRAWTAVDSIRRLERIPQSGSLAGEDSGEVRP